MYGEIEKADVLIEAIPYIRRFAGSVVVVKYGGSAMVDEDFRRSTITDIAMLKYLGLKVVVVHGGGNEITGMLSRLGKKSEFVNGLRVTDKETAKVAEMVLSGSISKNLVENLEANGISAVGINGKDGHTLVAKMKGSGELGYVGEVVKVDTRLLTTLMEQDFVPVVSPVGVDGKGETLNINADYVASAVAGALHARKLVFLTDVEGILADKDNPQTIIRQLSEEQAEGYVASGIISGGMIPKVECCLDGLRKGVESVHILNGRNPHAILLEIFTHEGVGTMLYGSKEES